MRYGGTSPFVFILAVFQITVWRTARNVFSALTFCLKCGLDFLADVLCLVFVDYISERKEIIIKSRTSVNALVDRNQAYICSAQLFPQHSHLHIVSSQSAHIFYNDSADIKPFFSA